MKSGQRRSDAVGSAIGTDIDGPSSAQQLGGQHLDATDRCAGYNEISVQYGRLSVMQSDEVAAAVGRNGAHCASSADDHRRAGRADGVSRGT